MAVENLTAEQKKFLDDSNIEFANRYTFEDEDYKEVYDLGIPDPPIVSPWYTRSNFGNRGRGRGSNYNNQNNRYGEQRNSDNYNRDNRYQDRRHDNRDNNRYQDQRNNQREDRRGEKRKYEDQDR